MIINGILTEVKNNCYNMKSGHEDENDKNTTEMIEQRIHTWNLFFSLTELSRGDLDAEI